MGQTEIKAELQRTQSPHRRDAMRALTSAIIAAGPDAPREAIGEH